MDKHHSILASQAKGATGGEGEAVRPRRERVYVVRAWLEPGPDGGAWRASVREGSTGEVRHFAEALALARFLLSTAGAER